MKRILSLFASNWGLKILALALAIAVFYSMKGTTAAGSRDAGRPSFLKGPEDGGQ